MAGALREVLARFGVSFDDTELKKGDKAVDGMVDKLGQLGKMLAGGILAKGIWGMISGLAEQADALAKQAVALGVSTDELQQWQHAAGLSGATTEEFNGALTKFNKNVADAAAGTGPAADAFRQLGVKVKDASGKLGQPIDLLDGVAAGLEKIKNPAQRTQAIMSLFGKSGAKLIPLFNEGAEGIAKLRAEVAELGGGFSPDFAKRSEAMNDAITRLNMAWLSFKVRVGGLVIPLVERFVVIATKVTSAVTKWVDKTGILAKDSHLAAAAAVVLGLAFFRAGLKAILPWLPMIAMFAAIILLVDELITLWQGGDTLIGRAIDSIFGEGSSQKAVAWVKEVVAFTEAFFADTSKGWANFKAGVELIWFDLLTSLKSSWVGAGVFAMVNGSIDGTIAVARLLGDVFTGVWKAIASGAESTAKAVGKVIDAVPGAGTLISKIASVPSLIGGAGKATIAAGPSQDADAIARQRAMIMDRASGPTITAPMVNAPVEINVTVPPGTPAQQARAVGAAAANGIKAGNRATKNALAHTAG